MNETHLGNRLKSYLDDSLALPPATAARLHGARERALALHHAVEPSFALPGVGSLRLGAPFQRFPTIALSLVLLVAAMVGVQQWQHSQRIAHEAAQQAAEIEEIDAGLLSGELPIDAYLDTEFDAWLKRTAE